MVALYELEQANSRVIEGYEINRAINFESNILGDTDERLSKLRELLHFFQKLTLTDDAGKLIDIGALYNLLLYIFAEEAGKKINNVLTPKEVIGLVAELIGDNKDNNSLCDPVSGSGTLLVEVGKRVGIRGANIFGQEANWNQYALTKMNLMLNGFKDSTFFWGDSLSNPKLTDDGGLKRFDIVASIPPFADKWATEEAEFDRYGRFQYGIPPRSQATWAYISHILASLKPNGRAVVVVPWRGFCFVLVKVRYGIRLLSIICLKRLLSYRKICFMVRLFLRLFLFSEKTGRRRRLCLWMRVKDIFRIKVFINFRIQWSNSF